MSKVSVEFSNLIGYLNDAQFWEWARDWFDEQLILDIANDWEDDIKKEEIENLKRILKKKKIPFWNRYEWGLIKDEELKDG